MRSLYLHHPSLFYVLFCHVSVLNLHPRCLDPRPLEPRPGELAMANLELFGHSIPSWLGLDLGFGIGNQDVAMDEPITVPDNGGQVPKEGATPEDGKGEAEVKKVACSRCESLDTKFCYFNNCNANQPRHYCRSCERYWTAGGTLRDTPMGSGRRKRRHSSLLPKSVMSRHLKKSSPQNFSYLSTSNISESGAPPVSGDSAAVPIIEGIRPQGQKVLNDRATNGLSKLSCTASNERQACEMTEASKQATGFMDSSPFSFPMGPWSYGYGLFGWNNEAISLIPHIGGRATNGLSKLSCTASNERQACEMTEASKQATGFMGSSPFSFPMGPWPYGYGLFGWNNEAISPIPHIGGRSFTTPSLNTWGLPWPPMPIPAWNIPPWGPTTAAVATAKHCSKGSQTVAKTNGCLFTPKTLRIHDSEEAAQSSIWSALGLDNRSDLPVSAAGIFNGSPLKADYVAKMKELPLQTLHANPTATSQSMTYHENN